MKRSPLARVGSRGRARAAAFRQAKADKTIQMGEHAGRCEFPHVKVLCLHREAVPCAQNDAPLHDHHVELRSANSERIGDVDNLKRICQTAHNWVHNNPAKARQIGFYGRQEAE